MSQHGCPERLSNRSKGFQDDVPSQSTMEVLVETLTGTAFEMTVLPTDTIFTIKSKIFRVEGIPVSQQHLLYNLKELEDAASLRDLGIVDGARLRLVLGMRGGPISTRRLPPPPAAEPWRDIERLLDTNRDDVEWGGSGCKVTVLVFRDGERVNMLRVKENHDGTYSPLEHNKYSGSSSVPGRPLVERAGGGGGGGGRGRGGGRGPVAAAGGALHDNAVTMTKMLELRRRMESLSVQRTSHAHVTNDKVEIQKTRSEETLSVPSLLDERCAHGACNTTAALSDDEALAAYDRRAPQALRAADFGPLVCAAPRSWVSLAARGAGGAGGASGAQSASASSLHVRGAEPALAGAVFSSSTSDLDNLKRNPAALLPSLSRHPPRSQLHLSAASGAGGASGAVGVVGAGAGGARKARVRCAWCRKRLSVASVHSCRCGRVFCAPHRYAEVHGCCYDYRAASLPRDAADHKLPRI